MSHAFDLGYVRVCYCFTPYQRLNDAPLIAFYDTLEIRRTYSRLKPPASSRGTHAFELGSDYRYFFKVSIYHAGERSEPENFDNTEIKTGIGPLFHHETSTQDPTSDKSQGVGSRPPAPPPPSGSAHDECTPW